MDQHRFHRIAHAGALALAVFDDLESGIEVGSLIHIHVADAFVMLDHRDGGLLHHRADQPFAAAGDDKVDERIHLEHHGDSSVVRERDQLHRTGRHTGGNPGIRDTFCQRHIGLERFRTAAEDHGITGLETETGGIHGHVGTGFKDEPDHPDRHGNFIDPDPVGAFHRGKHMPDRIFQCGHITECIRDSLDTVRGQQEAVQHGTGHTFCPAPFHIFRVGGEDRFVGRIQSVRHGKEPLVLDGGGGIGKDGRSSFCAFSDLHQCCLHGKFICHFFGLRNC